MPDQLKLLNQDLVLQIKQNIDPAVFDLNKYEGFIDAFCGGWEHQKDAIRNSLRYLLGGQYRNLTKLAEENFKDNDKLKELYGSFREMKKHLQLPNQLSCSIDLATGTGKSWVIYAIARIMLAEGAVDNVLVVCPSTTIETGLMDKFKRFSGDDAIRSLLPQDAVINNPHIINATESITTGTICVENCHALYEHVKSSIRDSLSGKGERTLVINDETHHVYNQTGKDFKKWKEFLLDKEFGFKYVVGLSGTCYINNEYFVDVISRYSLRQAIEDGFIKTIDYVAQDTSTTPNEKFQKIYDNHIEIKNTKYRLVKPLTIFVTKDVSACNKLTDDLIGFISEKENIAKDDAAKKVLEVTSSPRHKANIPKLADVDRQDSPVEWITSVSMLTEGWDVKNVFQIVPHEERAFNSKLLISQVLGRGLRIPEKYANQRPVLTIFNHDRWSGRIAHLVDEVLEIEKRIYSYPVKKDPDYNFVLHNVDYDRLADTEEYKQEKEYEFKKGFITLVSQAAELEKETEYVRAVTGKERSKMTRIEYKMFSVEDIIEQIHNRFKSIDMETVETDNPTSYAKKYSKQWLRKIIKESLRLINEKEDKIDDANRQRIWQAFGVIERPGAKVVRYKMTPNAIEEIDTTNRNRNSAGMSAIRHSETTVFWDDNTSTYSDEEVLSVLKEIEDDETLPRSATHKINNVYDFKTPLNVVLTNHKPERLFVRELIKAENSKVIDTWIKSTDQEFYSIEYAWRKGEHPKRGKFNPDFFLKVGKQLLVVEIKDDEEASQPSEENIAKYKAAKEHFEIVNQNQNQVKYRFNFLTPQGYDLYFDKLRQCNNNDFLFTSELDAVLGK